MADERARRILDAFDAALDQPPAAREAWLHAHHGDDPAFVAAVAALLARDAAPTCFPGVGVAAALVAPPRVGVWRLVERIGAGAMGEVWAAERDDGLFEQRVAVKLMLPWLMNAQATAFFDSERRLLARMRHPDIARLFDGGVSEGGIPWFAMDLVAGVPIDAWAAALPPARPRAGLRARVAVAIRIGEAVQHAHEQLIVHADLKPQNILVDAAGVPHLVDFGIAHLLSAEDGSRPGGYPRTPAYASPERLAGAPPSVRDDVYAIGTILHGLLTGRWEPTALRPSDVVDARHARLLRGDLDAIVARARATDAAARYPTVAALVADLRAWCATRSVAARGGGWRYAARRFVQRYRWQSAAAALALLATVAGVATVTTLYLRAERRFAEVRALARFMLVDMHDGLEPLAGASGLRARTAAVGRTYLERLSHDASADVDLRRELAVGYGRVGHTMAVTATNGTAGMEAGDRSLARAQALLEQLVAEAPARDDLKVELARILTWRSSVQAYARSDLPGAHRLLDRAIALDDAVLARRPGDVDAAYGRWLAVLGRLDAWSADARWAEIARTAQDQRRRAATLPTPARFAALRPLMEAAVDNVWGDALDYTDRPRAALAHYLRAWRTLARALGRASADVRVRTRMIGYAYQLSSTYRELDDRAAALDWATRGVRDARVLTRFEASPTVLGMANLVTLQHATLLVEAGRAREAVAEAKASVEQRRLNALAEPTSDDARSSYLFALSPLVEILDLAGQGGKACETARTAHDGWAALYRGRTPPRRQAGDIARLAERVRTCPDAAAAG